MAGVFIMNLIRYWGICILVWFAGAVIFDLFLVL
jgi:hypothetical protein